MDGDLWGTVIFGDVVRSRREAAASSEWLARLVRILDARYAGERSAPFGYTQGDELQGLLEQEADPFGVVALAMLHESARPMRWVIRAGQMDPGSGPATQRTGEAFLEARRMLEGAGRRPDALLAATGDPRADRLLEDLAPVLGEMLGGLRPRQRQLARLALLEGRRQAEIAELLGVRRATISVSFRRAGIRSLERMLNATRSTFAEGSQAARTAAS